MQHILVVIKKNLGENPDSAIKTLKATVNLTIDRVFLSQITWTGKTNPTYGERKIPLQKFKPLLALLFSIVLDLHTRYNKEKFHDDMVKYVLKNAYR